VLLSSQQDYPIASRRREVLEQRNRLEPEDENLTKQGPVPSEPVEEEALAASTPEGASRTTAEGTVATVQGNFRPDEDNRANSNPSTSAAGEHNAPLPPVTASTRDAVADLIRGDTPPHVAAALRCVEKGRQLLDRGQVSGAREWFERALSLDGNNPYAYYFLAATALREGRLDQAEAFLARAHTLSSQVPVLWQSRFWVLRGSIWEAVGRFRDARQAYSEAASLDPANVQARDGLARLSAPQ
jgi:tetratricopeptide (TPR) repeat protein